MFFLERSSGQKIGTGERGPKSSPSPVKSSALHRIVTLPGVGIEIVSRQSPTFQSGPSSPQLLLTTCQVVEVGRFTCRVGWLGFRFGVVLRLKGSSVCLGISCFSTCGGCCGTYRIHGVSNSMPHEPLSDANETRGTRQWRQAMIGRRGIGLWYQNTVKGLLLL